MASILVFGSMSGKEGLGADDGIAGMLQFEDFTTAVGLADMQGYHAAWGDYDNDGHLDLVADGRLFRNSGSRNAWVKLRLVGTRMNRAAIGAQVRIRVGGRVLTRQVSGGTGETHQNDLTLHFGLGRRADPVPVHVRWLGGREQTVVVPINTTTTIVEAGEEVRRDSRPARTPVAAGLGD